MKAMNFKKKIIKLRKWQNERLTKSIEHVFLIIEPHIDKEIRNLFSPNSWVAKNEHNN